MSEGSESENKYGKQIVPKGKQALAVPNCDAKVVVNKKIPRGVEQKAVKVKVDKNGEIHVKQFHGAVWEGEDGTVYKGFMQKEHIV